MTGFNNMYTEQYWKDLIKVIIERIGVKQFTLISTTVLCELGHEDLMKEIIISQANYLNKVTQALQGNKD